MDDWKSRLVIKSMLPHFAMVGNRQEPRKLQESGTLKRRQEGDNYQFAGMADGGYPNKVKRPCLEDVTLSMGPGTHPSTLCTEMQVPMLSVNPSSAVMGVPNQSLLLENNAMNGSVTGPPFGVPPTPEMELKEPSAPCYEKNSPPAEDQELQDLLEELTKIQEPSSSELDLENILGSKPEEPLVLHPPQATVGMPPKLPVQMPQMESVCSSKAFASSCSQVTGVSVPIMPSSTGISHSVPSTSKQMVSVSPSTTQAKNQAQAMLPVTLPPLPVPQWHHANQLKALAASKQGSATKHPRPCIAWSGLPPTGISPPYRPVPSPHPPPPPLPPPPFGSQSFMGPCISSNSSSGSTVQASPNALLSSMTSGSSATMGPTLHYVPEKHPSVAVNQQPQFGQQSSILANLVSSAIKSPQGHLMSALPTSNPGPSPPYRPEKLSSPGLPQQSFTPQYSLIRSLPPTSTQLSQQQQQQQQQQQANAIFKSITSNSSKTMTMIMQQGLTNSSPEAPEPFTFGNTKPLSHFVSEPGPQKIPSMPAPSRQQSLLHYLQQPTPAQASSATASSTATATLQLQPPQPLLPPPQPLPPPPQPLPPPPPPPQPDHSAFLLQQMMQQSQRFQRSVASDSMPTLPRQVRGSHTWCSVFVDQESWNSLTHVDKACKLGEARPPQVSLGRQPPSCQALGSESFLPGSSFAHELARVTSSYSTSEAAPWGGWDPKDWRQVPAPLLPSCDAAGKSLLLKPRFPHLSTGAQPPAQPARLPHGVIWEEHRR
uniref:Mastermind like domain containing 1 n=1 Tax=Marmota marmota marmota TaxID=9994 RepID=A0A8C6ET37_MARMA